MALLLSCLQGGLALTRVRNVDGRGDAAMPDKRIGGSRALPSRRGNIISRKGFVGRRGFAPPLGVLTLKEINLSEVSVFADESGGQSDNAYRAAMGVG